MVLCDAFYSSVKQGRMAERVVGGVECQENCVCYVTLGRSMGPDLRRKETCV